MTLEDLGFCEKGRGGPFVGGAADAAIHAKQVLYFRDRPDLLARFIADALRAGEKLIEGHGACSRDHMEVKIARVRCPTLVAWGTEDPFASPQAEVVGRHIPGSQLVPLVGGTVAVIDEMPEAFACLVLDFLREPDRP